MRTIKIKHPEWLRFCNIESTFKLAKQDRLPEAIAGWMLVTSVRYALRIIYGSDLKAAWVLMGMAVWQKVTAPYRYLSYLWHRKEYEREELQELCEDVKHEITESE
jgi:hypothetical protein